ncbi:MAG TPA: sugar transferase [Planctomycetota bacterium]|nr:sugar transferase [Planctomycetota bacterium]HRR79579.1 sugar transferase [Planctomycetota bacterium]HRT94421.1 sugar transferase [Planctomycetota bacterium]
MSSIPAPHSQAGRRRAYRAAKRALDLALAALGLLAFSWLFVLLAVLVKLTSRGPVFFHQQRVGRGGRPFLMLKFRSMRVDAELARRELAHRNEMDGPVFKMRRDPRITRVGRFLRRSSLDELPQLLNVLAGHMSLVGPRPLPLDEAQHLPPEHQRRHAVRPGLTGLWQVRGRNDLPYAEMMRLDLEYVERCSLGLDLRILAATLPAVLSGRGAF